MHVQQHCPSKYEHLQKGDAIWISNKNYEADFDQETTKQQKTQPQGEENRL